MNKENGQKQEGEKKVDYIPGLVVIVFIITIILAA
jgi:hypothetical protein